MANPSQTFAEHFADFSARYDVLLCDVWGVIHDGVTAHAAACDALLRFRNKGGAVVLVTNAPRPSDVVARQLDKLKVGRDVYDGIVSSGDVTRHEVVARDGQTIFHIGPQRDLPLFGDLKLTFAPAERADYVVCTGLFDDTVETPEDYRDLLTTLQKRELFMVCANPDVVVSRGADLVYCAGALADLYGDMGGKVTYAGKPYPPIYREALAMAEKALGRKPVISRTLAIGDSVRTDLKGAHDLGLGCLFIAGGIHAEEVRDPAAMAKVFADAGVTPTAVMQALRW